MTTQRPHLGHAISASASQPRTDVHDFSQEKVFRSHHLCVSSALLFEDAALFHMPGIHARMEFVTFCLVRISLTEAQRKNSRDNVVPADWHCLLFEKRSWYHLRTTSSAGTSSCAATSCCRIAQSDSASLAFLSGAGFVIALLLIQICNQLLWRVRNICAALKARSHSKTTGPCRPNTTKPLNSLTDMSCEYYCQRLHYGGP